MQAVSGAGYPGVASLDILGNVVPFIKNEEEKLQEETLKLLGRWNGHAVDPLNAKLSAHCNRVPVEDGHMESRQHQVAHQGIARRVDRGMARVYAAAAVRDCPALRSNRWSL